MRRMRGGKHANYKNYSGIARQPLHFYKRTLRNYMNYIELQTNYRGITGQPRHLYKRTLRNYRNYK